MSECERFLAAVNAVLDGDAPAAALADPHARTCDDCRGLAAAARLLAAAGPALRTPPVVRADLTIRLVTTGRRSRWREWAAVAAGVLAVGVGVYATRPGPEAAVVRAPAPKVSDQLAALSGVARRAGEQASAPMRLVPSSSRVRVAPPPRPAADPLAPLGEATRTAAAPLTDTTRRAFGVFLRDFGLSSKPAG